MAASVGSEITTAAPEQAEMALGAAAVRTRRRRTLRIQCARLLVVLCALGLWQYAGGRWAPDFIISSPTHVLGRLTERFGTGKIWPDIWVTTQELILGYSLGVASGTATGFVLGAWPAAGAVFEPIITAINGIPKVALAPLFLIWLGIEIWSKVAIAAMTVFFVMFYNTYLGMKTVPESLVNVLRIMGANRPTIATRVIFPSIAVPILAGLKASIPFAMIGVVVGEFVAADKGVGYYIRYSTDMYDSAGVYGGILVLLVMILIGHGLISVIQARVLRWRSG